MMSDREVVVLQVVLSLAAVLAIQRWRQWAGTIVVLLLAALYMAQGLEQGEELRSYADDVLFFFTFGAPVPRHASATRRTRSGRILLLSPVR